MKLKILLLLLITLLWGVISWNWYACNIKGLCGKDKEPVTIALPVSTPEPVLQLTDQDQDGLNDTLEQRLGTNPQSADSDGDGIPDSLEIGADQNAPLDTDKDGVINALDTDDDNDGIITLSEFADPNHDYNLDDAQDCDGDNIPNYLDANEQDGPFGDLDRDGLMNRLETLIGTAPYNKDSDGDGIKDGVEVGRDQLNPKDTNQDSTIDALEPYVEPQAGEEEATEEKTKSEETKQPTPDPTKMNVKIQTPDQANIYFPFNNHNKVDISAETNEYFTKIIDQLLDGKTLHIIGHTDNVGAKKSNEALGLKRAQMVRQLLVERGAPEENIKYKSKGETHPIATNDTEDGRSKNRRVELILKK